MQSKRCLGIVKDFFEVRIWIVFLSDVLIGTAIGQDVLHSEGKSAIVGYGSRIFSVYRTHKDHLSNSRKQ